MYACTHCNITFSALATYQDDDNDESYEFCPGCGNDMFLVSGDAAQAFIAQMKPAQPEQITIPQTAAFDVAAWQAERDRQEAAKDERLEEYQRIYASEGKAAAERYLGEPRKSTIDISQIKLTKIA